MLTPSDVMGELAPAYPLSGGGPTQRAPCPTGADHRLSTLRTHAGAIAVQRPLSRVISRKCSGSQPSGRLLVAGRCLLSWVGTHSVGVRQ